MEILSSTTEAFNHQSRHPAIEQEHERWEKAVEYANGKLHGPRTFQPSMEILSHALESYNLNFVPTKYYYIAKRYSEVRYDRKYDLATAKMMQNLQAYNYLLKQDFPKCDEICKELQEPYWEAIEGPPGISEEPWTPVEPLWIPVFFWKCSLIRSLAMPYLAHGKGTPGFYQNIEEHFSTIDSDDRHHRYFLDPTILVRLLIGKDVRASLISRGTTEKDLDEAGIVRSDAELERIRFWYWNRPDHLVIVASAA
ncbi:MAG: hypothetical protein Q9215_000204 [Flavoplaca cf. flavocitrina]